MSNHDHDDDIISDDDLALLDKTLDEFEDLPGFDVPVNGRYLLNVNRNFKRINSKTCVEAEFVVMDCVEQSDDTEPPTPKGTKFSQLFFLTGEEDSVRISTGMLKQLVRPLSEKTGENNMLKLVRDEMKDWLMLATVTRRADKKNPDVVRARLSLVENA